MPRDATIHFIRRIEPSRQCLEDIDTARLVARIQSGDTAAFATLYKRYFDRVYLYLHSMMRNAHEAEDAAQQVFTRVFEALPSYEHRRSFWVWLLTVVRNTALKELRKANRLQVEDPAEVARRRDAGENGDAPGEKLTALSWVTDQDLTLFVSRLPLSQRQVLLMRYMLDLPMTEIAAILDRTPNEVYLHHSRALRFLRDRLTAIGREPKEAESRHWRARTRTLQNARARRFALSNHL